MLVTEELRAEEFPVVVCVEDDLHSMDDGDSDRTPEPEEDAMVSGKRFLSSLDDRDLEAFDVSLSPASSSHDPTSSAATASMANMKLINSFSSVVHGEPVQHHPAGVVDTPHHYYHHHHHHDDHHHDDHHHDHHLRHHPGMHDLPPTTMAHEAHNMVSTFLPTNAPMNLGNFARAEQRVYSYPEPMPEAVAHSQRHHHHEDHVPCPRDAELIRLSQEVQRLQARTAAMAAVLPPQPSLSPPIPSRQPPSPPPHHLHHRYHSVHRDSTPSSSSKSPANHHSPKAHHHCEHCQEDFDTRKELKRHQRTTHQPNLATKPWACDLPGCDKRYTDRSSLTKHMRSHTGLRPYVCSHASCGKSFVLAAHLSRHNQVHSGNRPHRCSVKGCDKRFLRADDLRTHLRVHTGERPYECTEDDCGKRFTQASALSRHRRTQHPLAPPMRVHATPTRRVGPKGK